MLKFYIKAREVVESLRSNQDGVVSFEYVIVAGVVVAAVVAAFKTNAGGIAGALTTALATIVGQVNAAI
jgi:hypothetical protein